MYLFKKLVVCLTLVSVHFLQGMTIGSNTVPSRQASSVAFTGVGNQIIGFVVMENGFSLANNATACLYNAFFPIGRTIALGSGTLTLNQNFSLLSTTVWTTGGVITGNGYQISLPDIIGTFTVPSNNSFSNVELICNSDVIFTGSQTINGNCIITGNGYSINFTTTGALIIAANAKLTIQNARINGITTSKIVPSALSSNLILIDSTWIQSGDYTMSTGALTISGEVVMTGTSIFSYRSTAAATIATNSKWYFDSGMTFKYDPTNAASNLLAFAARSSLLYLYETTLWVTSGGLRLLKGTMTLEGVCPLRNDGVNSSAGIILGDGTNVNNDFDLKVMAESGASVQSGFFVYNNVS